MEGHPRYLVGIDLGTTNSAIAYVDTHDPSGVLPVRLLSVPQLTARGFVEPKNTLPSFCYLLLQGEWSPGDIQLPWHGKMPYVVGELAKEQGALVPTRLVSSAKSWLCNAAADRTDRILPTAAEDSLRISPVEATRRYLAHLRDAWNHAIASNDPHSELDQQEVILTVPASFDEVARTLTARAAQEAGLTRVTLLEEPQAAFYEWIRVHEKEWTTLVLPGQLILVCDVGGGTTDFSLIEVVEKEGIMGFQRLAVGDHLLLGGDNMDAMLAHHIAQRFQEQGCAELTPMQWLQIRHEARRAKERLLAEDAPTKTYQVHLQASGSRVVGGSLSLEVSAQEVQQQLGEGFFGLYHKDEALKIKKRQGIRSMGLPYEEEPSITKHLANFLFCQASGAETRCPDVVLFNGGAMKPEPFQQAIVASLARWYGTVAPRILSNTSLDLSVSRGAAYYGKARRGWGVTISGGLPRSYYLKVDVQGPDGTVETKALTLLPRGSLEGATYEPDQTFALSPNRPVSFQLLSSHVRLHDKQGELLDIVPEEMQPLPPLHTVIRFGKGSSDRERIPVHLGLTLTPIGTLSLWLRSLTTSHRWDLEFQVRKATGQEDSLAALGSARNDELMDASSLKEAKDYIEAIFNGTSKVEAGKVMESLESLLQRPRRAWPPSVLRALADALLDQADKRKRSPALERRWWNLLGFCLRPGLGYPLDDFRMQRVWKLMLADNKPSSDPEVETQRYICLRRLAAGLNKGQQMQIASSLLIPEAGKAKELKGAERYQYSERVRALAAMERVELKMKTRLATQLLERIEAGVAVEAEYWALGRLGTRQLLFGSMANAVPADICSQWIQRLLKIDKADHHLLAFPLGQMARHTEHRELNVSQTLVEDVKAFFAGTQDSQRLLSLLSKAHRDDIAEQEELFGDSLPPGLLLIN